MQSNINVTIRLITIFLLLYYLLFQLLFMDFSDQNPTSSGKRSPRRELQGPRPAPLKVRKDSHKVKKPPLNPQAQQHRPPVIIYQVSPKVIHTNPGEFMSLVQRLTGNSTNKSSQATASNIINVDDYVNNDILDQLQIDHSGATSNYLDRGGYGSGSIQAGILSPAPASMPMISPNLFSPPVVDASTSLSFLHEMSPATNFGRNYVDNSFLVSPGNLLSTSFVNTPSGYWDLFNQYQDLMRSSREGERFP